MMYYHVLLGKKHIDLIKANSKEEAVKKIESLFGLAKTLSKNHKYLAVEA
jgi:hypothetical protein